MVVCATILGVFTFARAQTPCLVFIPGTVPPTGYGAAWDVFSANRDLLVRSDCPSSGQITVTVGTNSAAQAIYNKIYIYGGGGWQERALEGTALSSDWLSGQGRVNVSAPPSASVYNPFYFVAYVCTNRGTAGWKCGCNSAACTIPRWQLQAYTAQTVTGGTGATSGQTTSGTVTGGATGGGQPVGSETALCYPTSGKRTIQVANTQDFRDKFLSAQPGDHYVFAGGTYQGINYYQNGTAQEPIVLKPASGAIVTFNDTVYITGSYGVIAGFSFSNRGKILMNGHHNRITRNYFFDQNVGSGGVIETSGDGIHHNRIDHNHFHRITGAAFRSDGWSNDGATDNQGTRFDHNYIQGHTVGGNNESVALMLGDAYSDAQLLYDHNLFDDVLNNYESIGQSEIVSIKTSGTTFRGNTIINSPGAYVTLRQSNNSIVENNYLDGGRGIRVMGDNHVIRGNTLLGGASIDIAAGDGTMDTRRTGCEKSDTSPVLENCTPVHAAARNTLVHDNVAPIVVGEAYKNDTVKVTNTTLRNNSRLATLKSGFHEGTVETGVGGHNTTARRLSLADVGRSAPDPSCQ
jgi:hypothetical protein